MAKAIFNLDSKSKKVIRGYIAMNKNDFDIENISFYSKKREAIRAFGKSQEIKKVTVIINL